MDLFMPAERVLYNRSYYFSDEAVDDYNEYIADRDGVNIDVVSSLDFFMNEVWKEIDYAIDNDLSDEISCFDRMLRDLKCGGDPEHASMSRSVPISRLRTSSWACRTASCSIASSGPMTRYSCISCS